jgi:hypothetical protein
MTSYLKMAAVQEKAICVLWFFETKSVIRMQRRDRTQYGKDPPSDNSIRRWLKQFQKTGSVLHQTENQNVCCNLNSYTANARASYVPGKVRILKLFSIVQY